MTRDAAKPESERDIRCMIRAMERRMGERMDLLEASVAALNTSRVIGDAQLEELAKRLGHSLASSGVSYTTKLRCARQIAQTVGAAIIGAGTLFAILRGYPAQYATAQQSRATNQHAQGHDGP